MRVTRYRGRHLRPRPKKRGPVVFGTAAAVWMAGPAAHAAGHVVQRGDTLSSIATRYGTTAGALAEVNGLRNPNLIIAGQRLRVPTRLTLTSVHRVSPGETLSAIAARYGISVRTLARANRVADQNLIVAGSTLKVPGGSSPSTAVSSSGRGSSLDSVHRVQAGETLSAIAARYGTSVTSMARANNLHNPSLIVVGTNLRVPGTPTHSPASAPPPASTASIQASLESQSAAHGVDTSLVKAVAYLESGWQQDVVSSKGARGVMQVMPGTARYINRSLDGGSLDIDDADDNVHLGVMYLRHMLAVTGTERRALAAYYSGPGNVRGRLEGYQRHYVRNVQTIKKRY